jgi:hypothetical protein
MSTVSNWKKVGSSGLYALAGNWTNGVPDSTTAEAYLGPSSTAYTVTSTANETVDFLDDEKGATLALNASVFTVFNATAFYSNCYVLGTIDVNAGAMMVFGKAGSPSTDSAEFNGGGTVNISGSSTTFATLDDAAPWMGVYGAKIALSGKARIIGLTTGGGNTFQNQTGVISGYGTIGNGAAATGGNGLVLTNAHKGTIDGTGGAGQQLVLNTGKNRIENAGTIETTGAGGLAIASYTQLDGSLDATGSGALAINGAEIHGGGTVNVSSAGSIRLNNGEFSVGLISIAAGGKVLTTAGNTTGVDANNDFAGDILNTGDIENAGTITVANDSTLNINASVYGAGSIALAGLSGPTKLEIYGDGAAFFESGGIVLSNSAENSIVSHGAGEQLSNFARISGAGTIGDTWLRLYNAPTGVVLANGSVGLTIVGDSAAVAKGSEKINFSTGLIETTGAGGLTIKGELSNAGYLNAAGAGALTLNGGQVDTGGGVVETTGSGSIVLKNNSAISNQAYIAISAGGKLTTTAGDTADILETNVINLGAVDFAANSTVSVEGHWRNSTSVNLGATTTVDIEAGAFWELLNGGTVNLNGGSILSGGAGARLVNFNNTISGSGTLGDGNMEIDNESAGTIDATGAAGLKLNGSFLYNPGTLESSSAGGLTIGTSVDNPGELIANAGGKIIAQGAVYGPGIAQINGTGSIEFAAEDDNDVYFGGSGAGTLILDNYGDPSSTTHFYGNIYGFGVGDEIDLRDFAPSNHLALGANSGFGALDGTLTVTNGTSTSSALYLEGNYTASNLLAEHLKWSFSGDGHGGTEIKLVSA